MNTKIAFVGLLSIALLLLSSAPSFAWVYPECNEDLKFERFGPRVDRLIIRMYATDVLCFTAMEKGQFDIVDWSLLRYFIDRWGTNNATLKIIPFPPPGSERGYYLWDINNNPYPKLMDDSPNPAFPSATSEASFRHALAHCVNRADIVANVTEGLSIPMYTLILPYMAYWVHPDIRPGGALESLTHPFNVTMAAEILTDDGFIYNASEYAWRYWDGKPKADGTTYPKNGKYDAGEEFKLVIYGRSDHAWRNDMAARLSVILGAGPIKIDVDLHLVDRATCVQRVMDEKDFHMYTGGWIFMGPEPDYLYDLYHIAGYWHPGRPNNYGHYNITAYQPYAEIIKFPGNKTTAEMRDACLRAQEEWAAPTAVGAIPCMSTASPKAISRAYTGGNGGVMTAPDDGQNKYRGLMWKGIVNELGFGENSYWTKLNAHPAGYEIGDGQNMTLYYGWKVSDVEQLNIIYASWYWDMEILGNIYDTLLMRDPNTQADFIPWLAKKVDMFEWTDPADGKIKTGVKVTLRPGIKWSDGYDLTADDVVFSFMDVSYTLAKRGLPEPWFSSYVYPTAKSVYKVDPCTAVILYNYRSTWAKMWVGIAVPIIPRHIWKDILEKGDADLITRTIPGPDPNYIGTGSYKLVDYASGDHATLVRNPLFFHSCPMDVDPQIDAPEKYKGLQVFLPGTAAADLKFTLQIQNMFMNQCHGSILWIDKYVYFSNASGEHLLPGYPENIHLPGTNAYLHNITYLNMSDPVTTEFEQIGGCPNASVHYLVLDWEDNCNGKLDPCDKLLLHCFEEPTKDGWYHVETINPVPPYVGFPVCDPPLIEVAYADKEHIDLYDLPYPYYSMPSWPKGTYDIKVAVHVKGPPEIWEYTWTLSEFLGGTPAHYELVPNPWVCQWINVTFHFWVTLPEDLNLDIQVNILDAIALAANFGAKIGTRLWNARADINSDNTVNILDAIKLAGKFGWK